MLANLIDKVKPYLFDIFLLACVVLIAIISYNMGRIHALQQSPITIGQDATILRAIAGENASSIYAAGQGTTNPSSTPRDPRVVASKASSSKIYHHPWCSGAKRIKPENQLWFPTENDAKVAGYTLAANCQ